MKKMVYLHVFKDLSEQSAKKFRKPWTSYFKDTHGSYYNVDKLKECEVEFDYRYTDVDTVTLRAFPTKPGGACGFGGVYEGKDDDVQFDVNCASGSTAVTVSDGGNKVSVSNVVAEGQTLVSFDVTIAAPSYILDGELKDDINVYFASMME